MYQKSKKKKNKKKKSRRRRFPCQCCIKKEGEVNCSDLEKKCEWANEWQLTIAIVYSTQQRRQQLIFILSLEKKKNDECRIKREDEDQEPHQFPQTSFRFQLSPFLFFFISVYFFLFSIFGQLKRRRNVPRHPSEICSNGEREEEKLRKWIWNGE